MKRVLLKLSGEALMGPGTHGIDSATLAGFAGQIAAAAEEGFELAVVVGGGNFFRGLAGAETGMDRAAADDIGMLATVMNALALKQALVAAGRPAAVMSAVAMPSVCDVFVRDTARKHLEEGRVVVLGGGTGNPFFTTDTNAALRAAELGCDALLKGTQVDGVYSADPKKHTDAVRYDRLSAREAIEKQLGVMDTAAFALARQSKIPIIVFNIHDEGALAQVLRGNGRYTTVVAEED